MLNSIRSITQKFPFENLVFQGGGVKTFAYHGALYVLEEHKILNKIKRVAGTSAGATLATVLSFGLSVVDTLEILNSIDYHRITAVMDEQIPDWLQNHPKILEQPIDKIVTNVESFNRLIRKYGWYPNQYPYQWLQGIIAQKCGGNENATFRDFQRFGFKDLYVVATNISTHKATVFCEENTPNVAVADAVLMSASVPLLFQSVRFDGKKLGDGYYYADGGLVMNYPIHIFDDKKFAENNKNFHFGVNWATLGCRLYTPENCLPYSGPINNLLSYFQNMFEAMAMAQAHSFNNDMVDKLRTINISDCCVGSTDFHIQPSFSDSKYVELFNQGQEAAQNYLDNYSLPTDRFYELKSRVFNFFS